MPEGKENKRHSKIPAGITATSNRLETTKAVSNALKSVETIEELSFLKEASSNALAILAIIQGIDEGDIEDDFLALALDSLGLVYIVINQCEGESQRDGDIFDQMKVDSGELSRTLQDVAGFVEKKARRKLIKRIIKHSADEEKVDNYRQQLKTWMTKFGKSSDTSIHDVLQEVIDDKLRRLEKRGKKPKEMIAQSFLEADKPLTPLRYPPPVVVTPSPSPLPPPPKKLDEKPNKPLPKLDPLANSYKSPSRAGTPELRPQSQSQPNLSSTLTTGDEEGTERKRVEVEARRKKRLEEEKAKRLAERERWRKSEQDFIQLPQASPVDEEPTAASSSTRPAPVFVPKKPSFEIESDPEAKTTLRLKSTHSRSKSQIEEDERLAAALHANFQREFTKEDEEIAMSVAMKEQRSWEAEQEKRSGRSPKKGKKKLGPRDPSLLRNPSPELGYAGLRPEDIEGLGLEDRYGGPEKYLDPDPRASQFNRGRSSPLPLNDPSPSPYYYPVHPNPYPVYAPLPPSMSNITNSGISLGGGPVHVTNQNSGNVRNITITNSGNDYSVHGYTGADSD